jgi:aqualysin 1
MDKGNYFTKVSNRLKKVFDRCFLSGEGYMNKLFRFVSMMVVLVMVLGFFAAPMSGASQVSAQKEVPTFVVAPTDVPTQEPVNEPTSLPGTDGEVPVEEVTQVPTESPEVVPLIEAAAEVAVPGRYIIVFKDGVDKEAARQAALAKINGGGGRVAFEYNSAIDGITAEISPEVLRLLRQDGRIEFIEQDQKVSVRDEGEDPYSIQTMVDVTNVWGVDRIDQISNSLDHKYYYPYSGGEGVNIYIIDTGIRSDHQNFGGRVSLDFDAIGGSTTYAADCDGHGTHVAGTAAGNVTGVARKANLHSVRVLDCTGSGSTSQIIAGINWVAAHHIKPAVANMSLGGGLSPAEDAAVTKAIAKGVTFVVAAGNDDDNACNTSPAHVAGAITVGATDNTDTRASFSNYGTCVDIFAPGVDIYSSTMTSNSSYDGTWDGTSMASPHVAGVAALFLAANPTAKTSQVTAYIISNALTGIVTDPGTGSPNRLLHLPTNLSTGPIQLSPSKNLTSADQTPFFSWKPVTNGDIYHIILSAVSDCSVSLDGMFVSDPSYEYYTNLADGAYYWKVAAMNADSSQEAWSACWKFSIDHTGPAAPVTTFPTTATVNGFPTFKWLASAGAKAYRFGFDFDGNPTNGLEYTSPETTKLYYKPASLPLETEFSWYVQAKDSLGNWGSWSGGRQLTVLPLRPATPKLISLINNAATNDQTPELRWNTVLYAAYHRVEIASDPKFLNLEEWAEASFIDGRYPVSTTLPAGTHYWRVFARNLDSVDSAWSTTGVFVVDLTPPAAPSLNSPANGASVSGTPNFTWSVPVGAKTFEFQYDIDPGFPDSYGAFFLTKANHKPYPVMPVGAYNWRVRAYDSVGNPSPWSITRTVTILPPTPAKVNLTSPASGFYTNGGFIDLDWTAVDYADNYELEFDESSSFGSVIYSIHPIGEDHTSANINGLSQGKWYWRVRAVNSNGVAGPWSTARYFYKSTSTIRFFSDISEMSDFTQHPGATWNVASGGLYNDGIANSFNTSSISYNATLSNFSVNTQVIMDNASSEANVDLYGLVVRGTPTFNSWNDWTKGYYFMVTQNQDDEYNFGCFRVYSLKGNIWTMLSGFCDPAILESAWNTLDVSANGKTFQFRINGYLMWQGTDASYTSGRVGLFNYSYHCDEFGCFETLTHDRFSADYFRIGAPVNITSAEVVQPNPVYGIGPDPLEIR